MIKELHSNKQNKHIKVILGMSGGVDSSVCAIKLLEQGYNVEAMFMRNWDSMLNNDVLGNNTLNDDICPQEQDYKDAQAVCEKLDIKLHRVDFVKEYWDNVFEYFLEEYKRGRTPNPDIMCNKYIKFNAFLNKALELDADYIAMGHYARVEHDEYSKLLKGIDDNKDQTYFLCQLTQEQLKKTLFPIGDIEKKEVRFLADKYDLATAKKKDSTGICFIGERDFNKFLSNYLPAKSGNMVTLDGEVIREHAGLMYYTIGQRKGLGIGGSNKYSNEPWFVIGKDLAKNHLIIGQGFHHEYLYSDKCLVEDFNLITERKLEKKLKCKAKFRYRQKDVDVFVTLLDNSNIEVTYSNVRAVTPGQSCVLYLDDECLGGGIIKEVYSNNELRKY